MLSRSRIAPLIGAMLLLAACTGPGATPTPSNANSVCASFSGADTDLLADICERGRIVISTDADYAPQSSVTADGGYEGFDIDVGEEIGRRLGVDVEWTAQIWDTVIAGSWSERWD